MNRRTFAIVVTILAAMLVGYHIPHDTTAAAQTSAPTWNGPKWEYKVVKLQGSGEATLNQHGSEGWEATLLGFDGSVVLKRPVPK